MNKPIRFAAFFSLLLIIVLLVNITVVQGFSEEKYAKNPLNKREFIEQKSSPRGQISAGGQILAQSSLGEDGFYHRSYPNNGYEFGPITGYLSDIYGASGIEASYNGVLIGSDASPKQWWKQLTSSEKQVGNVELTIVPSVQQTAYSMLANAGYEGAVVAIRPSTGEILAMASSPSFNSQLIADENSAEQTWAELNANPGKPLLNHATQETLPPGSTFKVITTAAALGKGFTPDSQLTGAPQITLPGSTATLENYAGQTCAGSATVSLTTAFQYSCNTAFVELARGAGIEALRDTALAFGVSDTYNLGLPMVAGTVGDIADEAALGQSAIGQRDVAMSVLQNAVVAATVANKGERMEPHVVKRITAGDLTTLSETNPKSLGQAITPEIAATLTELMRASERYTSGYTGMDIASKTGTAEHGADSRNSNPHAWYIAFGPSAEADVAVAVVVKNGGDLGQAATGGSVAAPIGRAVIAAALQAGGQN